MVVRKSSSISISTKSTSTTSSRHSKHSPTCTIADCDTDDQAFDTVPMDDFTPSKPLSVAIPRLSTHGSHSARRPNLKDILSNTAAPPWTLTAFMAYLSNNHCLETLEFTMDAGRYKKHYNKMMSRATTAGQPTQSDSDNLRDLWQRLINAYIRPNASREVNLPSEVRDPILRLSYATFPPAPETLDPAVAKIYELMEDSVLVPFINSVMEPEAESTTDGYDFYGIEDTPSTFTPHTYEDSSILSHRRSRQARHSPPPTHPVEPHASSYSPPSSFSRKSAPSTLDKAMSRNRFSTKLSPTSSQASGTGTVIASKTSSGYETAQLSHGLTDDSGSACSPTGLDSPMTPPTSPPVGDIGSRSSRDVGGWKKLSRLSQWKPGRKRSPNRENETQTMP